LISLCSSFHYYIDEKGKIKNGKYTDSEPQLCELWVQGGDGGKLYHQLHRYGFC
jgi:hypothetical protein